MTACLSSTSIAFYDILAQACIEINILRQESDLRFSRYGFCIFVFFKFFFCFSFFPFSFLFAAVLAF